VKNRKKKLLGATTPDKPNHRNFEERFHYTIFEREKKKDDDERWRERVMKTKSRRERRERFENCFTGVGKIRKKDRIFLTQLIIKIENTKDE